MLKKQSAGYNTGPVTYTRYFFNGWVCKLINSAQNNFMFLLLAKIIIICRTSVSKALFVSSATAYNARGQYVLYVRYIQAVVVSAKEHGLDICQRERKASAADVQNSRFWQLTLGYTSLRSRCSPSSSTLSTAARRHVCALKYTRTKLTCRPA